MEIVFVVVRWAVERWCRFRRSIGWSTSPRGRYRKLTPPTVLLLPG